VPPGSDQRLDGDAGSAQARDPGRSRSDVEDDGRDEHVMPAPALAGGEHFHHTVDSPDLGEGE
jgi:hypothetical protein